MIRIEHIAFEFTAPDEAFARGLYAGWDDFCQRCFERVAEECLASYSDDRVLHELDWLDLNLGNIPEEDFYNEFPRRLREELLKVLPPLYGSQAQADSANAATSRSQNLLFYLDYGYLQSEWMDADFRVQEELDWLSDHSSTSYDAFIRKAALLCLKQEHALRRLTNQLEQEQSLFDLYVAALSEPSVGQAEKRRLLALLLEMRPDIPIRFVHETNDDTRLQDMSILLDTLSVRQLIRTETKEHAEVDLPPYWHYLYEWLIQYYPYNGIAMFGGKTEFTRHLHHRLLTFIHKRNGTPYLSKAELTVNFLLEIFGSAYYKDVLNAIYLLQPHNPDGSPIYDHYFNRELYHMFLRLSLLQLPEAIQEGATADESQEKTKEIQGLTEPEGVTALLTDTHTDDKEKHTLLSSFAQSHPEILIQWLQSEGVKKTELLSVLARLADKDVLDRLLASLSFTVWEQFTKAESHLRTYRPEILWLKEVTEATWSSAWRKSVLAWIGSKHYSLPEEESIRRLLLVFRNGLGGTANKKITDDGTGRGHEKDMEKLSAAIRSEIRQPSYDQVDTEELIQILKDPSRSDAYKRMLWTMLVWEQPEAVIQWLQSAYAKDNTLLPFLAELAENATVNRLLSAYSLAVFEAWGNIRNYLERQKDNITWLKGISEPQQASAFRLSALYLLASSIPEQADDVKNILSLIYREVTGSDKNENAAVDALTHELEEAGNQDIVCTNSDDLQDLHRIMHATNLSELVKRRVIAIYWDNHRDDFIEAVRLLQEQDMLDEVVEQSGHHIWENILYQTLQQAISMEKASALMPLYKWLITHEAFLSSRYYPADASHSFRAGLLLGTIRLAQGGNEMSLKEAVPFLLASLFYGNSLLFILKQLEQDSVSEIPGAPDAEQILFLLNMTFGTQSHDISSLYKEWSHRRKDTSNILQRLFESCWNTAEGFATWINDSSIPITSKREQLRLAAYEKPQEWLQLLRALPFESRAFTSLEPLTTTQELLGSMTKINFHQANVLSKIMERLSQSTTSLPSSLIHRHTSLESLMRKALLAYLQNPETLSRTLSKKEIADTFFRYLRLAATGKEQDDTDSIQWQQLTQTITDDSPNKSNGSPKEELLQALKQPSVPRTALRQYLACLMDKHPEDLCAWLAQEADKDDITQMAEVTGPMLIGYWTDFLTLTPGFAYPDAFRQLIDWLLTRMTVTELATALFFYVKEHDWKTCTPAQMETYFFSRLYGQTDILPPVETLADKNLPENIRKRLFRQYLYSRPEKLLAFLRETVSRNTLPLNEWLQWTTTSDWLYLAASLSLSKAELLRQITDNLSLPEEERRITLATYLVNSDTEEWPYATPQETVSDFIGMLPSMQDGDTEKKEKAIRRMEEDLALPETKTVIPETQPEILKIENAGLCLLAPWFVRLFDMLGYLDEEKKQFRNTASKVRAIFLLQYLVCGKEKSWRETELTFNRLLTALPGHIPLPRHLSLSDEERQTADNMVAGVKANWPQMNGTSVEGFRSSFLTRKGRLEQKEEHWLLTVEEKAYDILLETIPWGFRQIRLPWIKKYVQVKWHEQQIF